MDASDQHFHETYRRALEAAKEKSGKDRGAASWLANYLGISKQLLFHWRLSGFPDEYVPALAKLSELDPDDMATVTVSMPKSTWKRITERLPKSLINQAVVRK
jgi:hypothetical protein